MWNGIGWYGFIGPSTSTTDISLNSSLPRLVYYIHLFSHYRFKDIIEPVHEITNNVVCATSKASDQPAHTRSLIRAFASRLSII